MQNFSSLKCIGSSETISRSANPVVYLVNFWHDMIVLSQGLFDLKIHTGIYFFSFIAKSKALRSDAESSPIHNLRSYIYAIRIRQHMNPFLPLVMFG